MNNTLLRLVVREFPCLSFLIITKQDNGYMLIQLLCLCLFLEAWVQSPGSSSGSPAVHVWAQTELRGNSMGIVHAR